MFMQIFKQTHNNNALFIAASAVVLALFIVSFLTFTLYKPKTIMKISNIQGYKSEVTNSIPYPSGSKEISVGNTSYGRKVTLEASKTVSELNNYYNNIFDAKGWEVEYNETVSGTVITKYKNEGSFITVTISKQPDLNNTIVVLDEVIGD
ncbi:hypothetical protein A2793_01660 [candidate division WWE3 bacterium RIFCSPHIGHO2_01_FULL_38_45]|nr:MAG: hypothetical protein A2793_01660 [candidate division WWE3 bacterium RIFCSPHIGHO2_01_FULL_38_45]